VQVKDLISRELMSWRGVLWKGKHAQHYGSDTFFCTVAHVQVKALISRELMSWRGVLWKGKHAQHYGSDTFFHCCPRAGEGPDQPGTNKLEGCAVKRQACTAIWF